MGVSSKRGARRPSERLVEAARVSAFQVAARKPWEGCALFPRMGVSSRRGARRPSGPLVEAGRVSHPWPRAAPQRDANL